MKLWPYKGFDLGRQRDPQEGQGPTSVNKFDLAGNAFSAFAAAPLLSAALAALGADVAPAGRETEDATDAMSVDSSDDADGGSVDLDE